MTPADIVTRLQNSQIESRPAWKPMHMQPLYKDDLFVTDIRVFEHSSEAARQRGVVDEHIFNHTLCLPSGDALTDEQLNIIVEEIKAVL